MCSSDTTTRYVELLREVNSTPERDDKNVALLKHIGEIQQRIMDGDTLDDFEKRLVEFFESEWDHQYVVCTALRRIGNKRRHDWSKDYMYVFILAGKFKFQIEDVPEFGEKWLEEVNRHYKLEPHHSQHTQTGGVINRIDIEEMAIDQLARELFRFKGRIDADNMLKYLPKFESQNAAQHTQWFKDDIAKHTDMMTQIYQAYASDEQAQTWKCTIL